MNIDVGSRGHHIIIPRVSFVPCSLDLQAVIVVNPLQHCPNNSATVFLLQ